jgi:hypothetical protein
LVLRSRPPAPQPAPAADATIALPSDDPNLTPSPSAESPTPSPAPTRTPSPSPKPAPSPTKSAAPQTAHLAVFEGLSTWFDNYDYGTTDPHAAAASMRARGVKAIYLQTSRYTLPDDFKDANETTAWIRAAHANGMKIMGWYLPGYGNMERDVRRTVAIAQFRTPDGQAFDGLGIDIEDKCEIKGSTCSKVTPSQTMDANGWNSGIVTHMTRVRNAVGRAYPMAGIVPAPLGMAIRPAHWTGFPWRSLPNGFDVLMPMSYWSYRDDCADVPEHCAYGYTKGNVEQVRSLTGDATVPINVPGGVSDNITTQEVRDYVKAARDANAIGGSLYDYRTTKNEYWSPLAGLNQ